LDVVVSRLELRTEKLGPGKVITTYLGELFLEKNFFILG